MNSSSSKPLAKKYFYIDLKGFFNEKKLIKDLELLGAKQEVFLSKNISFVVSNRVSLADYGNSPSLVSNPRSKSPYFFKDSSINSPASNSPNFDSRIPVEPQVPLSRGMSVLQKAREKNQGSNKFILDICKQWNIKVYPIQKVLSWIEKYKAKYCKNITSQPKRGLVSENVTKLFSPVIKIEDKHKLYKPRYKMFSAWPEKVNSALLQCVKKLVASYKQSGNLDYSPRPPLKEIGTKSQNSFLTPKSASITQAYECTTSKATPYTSSKITGFNSILNSASVVGPPVKQKEKDHRFLKPKKEKHAKKRKLYCEICGIHYSDGEAHYEKKLHAKYLNNSANYDIVLKEISGLPTLDDFLKSLQAENGECKEGEKVFEDDTSRCSSFNIKVLDNFPKANEIKLDSCLTEVYSVNEDEIISASCSSVDSSLPFLETNDTDLSKSYNLKRPHNPLFKTRHKNGDSYSFLNPPILLPTFNDVYDHELLADAKKDLEINPPLLLPITNEVSNHDLPESVVKNLYEVYPDNFSVCNKFERNNDLNIDDSLMVPIDFSQSFLLNDMPGLENKNMTVDEFIKPISHNLASNVPENEICVPDLNSVALSVQEQDLQISYTCNTKVDTPLDLSCLKMNRNMTIHNYDHIITNDTSVGTVDDIETLNNSLSFNSSQNQISSKVIVTDGVNNLNCCNAVDFDSEDESNGSEQNFAGLDSAINNCLEQVTKSLLNDCSAVEEDQSKCDLINKNPTAFESPDLLKIACNVEETNEDKASGQEFLIFTENFPDKSRENAFLNIQTISNDPELCISDTETKIAEIEITSLKQTIKDMPLENSFLEKQSDRIISPPSIEENETKIVDNEYCSNNESLHQNLNTDKTSVKITIEGEKNEDEKSVLSLLVTHLQMDSINVHSEKYSVPNHPLSSKSFEFNNSDTDSTFGTSVNVTAAQSDQVLMPTTDFISPLSPTSLFCNKLPVDETLEKNSLSATNYSLIINENVPETDALLSTEKSSPTDNTNMDVNTSEKYDVWKISNSVLNSMSADISEELLASDDAYIVLDEADSSFKSVKGGDSACPSYIHGEFSSINGVFKNIHNREKVYEDIKDGVSLDVIDKSSQLSILNTTVSSITDSEKHGKEHPVTYNYNKPLTTDLITVSKCQVKEIETGNYDIKDFSVVNEVDKINKKENSDSVEKCKEAKTTNIEHSLGRIKLACDIRVVINAMDIQKAESVLNKRNGSKSENKDETSNMTECSKSKTVDKMFVCKDCFHDEIKKDIPGLGKRKYLNDNINDTFQETDTENNKSPSKKCKLSLNDCDEIKKDTPGLRKRKYSNDNGNDTFQETDNENNKPCKTLKLSLNDCDTINVSNCEHPLNSTVLNADDIDLEDPLTANAASINLQTSFFKTHFSSFDAVSINSKSDSSHCNSPSCESFCSSNEVNSSFSDILPSNFPMATSYNKDMNDKSKSIHIVYINSSVPPNSSIALT